ncbi:variable surface protein, partial [Plasmodium gonderi]
MRKTIYAYMNRFPKCKEIIDKYNDRENTLWESLCNKIKTDNSHFISSSNIGICYQTMQYLGHTSSDNNSFEEERCKYLYYWLYKKFKDKNNTENINSFYRKLIEKFNADPENHNAPKICLRDKGTIPEDELKNLEDIYDIETKLQKLKLFNACDKTNRCDCAEECAKKYKHIMDVCNSSYDDDLHKKLEHFKEEFINLELTTHCDNVRDIIYPPSQNFSQRMPSASKNSAHRFIIPTILIIIIPLILFV